MRVPVPKKITVCVDTREKHPLIFPPKLPWWRYPDEFSILEVDTKSVELPFGDYCLDGFANVCCVERKGSLREIATNLLTKDRRRADAAFVRLVEGSRHPYLLLDFTLGQLRPSRYCDNPHRVLDVLLHYSALRGLSILWSGSGNTVYGRTLVGEMILRVLWNTVWREAELAAQPGGPSAKTTDATREVGGTTPPAPDG